MYDLFWFEEKENLILIKVNFTYYLQISQERHHFLYYWKSSTTFTQMFLAIPQRSEKQADLLLASQLQGLNLLLS